MRINGSGTVVGFSTTRNNVYHAFVSFDGGKMQDLNKLIPRRSGWVLGEADGINDAGQIVGDGDDSRSDTRLSSHTYAVRPCPGYGTSPECLTSQAWPTAARRMEQR